MYKIQCRLNQMGIIQRKALHLHRFILDTAHYFFFIVFCLIYFLFGHKKIHVYFLWIALHACCAKRLVFNTSLLQWLFFFSLPIVMQMACEICFHMHISYFEQPFFHLFFFKWLVQVGISFFFHLLLSMFIVHSVESEILSTLFNK